MAGQYDAIVIGAGAAGVEVEHFLGTVAGQIAF